MLFGNADAVVTWLATADPAMASDVRLLRVITLRIEKLQSLCHHPIGKDLLEIRRKSVFMPMVNHTG
jgi:hypothetical protein